MRLLLPLLMTFAASLSLVADPAGGQPPPGSPSPTPPFQPIEPLELAPENLRLLEQRFVRDLKAVTDPQRAFLRMVFKRIEEKKLEPQVVLAVHRYAMQRQPQFPFPVFERAMRIEAGRRSVNLPASKLIPLTPGMLRELRLD